MTRPDWDTYFLGICEAVAERADCTRRKVGAVIVKDHRIVSTGYNGAPARQPGCLEGACPRGQHFADFGGKVDDSTDPPAILCCCGKRWVCPDAVEPWSSYDTGPGACLSVHAEANAIIYADYDRMQGADLYCTDEPCHGCAKLIMGAGILRVVTPGRITEMVRHPEIVSISQARHPGY